VPQNKRLTKLFKWNSYPHHQVLHSGVAEHLMCKCTTFLRQDISIKRMTNFLGVIVFCLSHTLITFGSDTHPLVHPTFHLSLRGRSTLSPGVIPRSTTGFDCQIISLTNLLKPPTLRSNQPSVFHFDPR